MSLPNGVLLDTSALIEIKSINLTSVAFTPLLVSTISMAELSYGLNIGDPVKRSRRIDFFYSCIENFEILPFDLQAAKTYGLLADLVRKIGRDPRPRRLDLQIAAVAASNKMPLLTLNPKDFTGTEELVDVISIS